MDIKTRAARDRLTHLLVASVGAAVLAGLFTAALAAHPSAGGSLLVMALFGVSTTLATVSLIGWGVMLGIQASGLLPADRAPAQHSSAPQTQAQPVVPAAPVTRKRRSIGDIAPLDPLP